MYDFSTIKLGLGKHPPGEGVGCFMEAASHMAGEAWSDKPKCVDELVAALGRALNDIMSSDERNMFLVPRIMDTLNTVGTQLDKLKRAYMVLDWYAHEVIPFALNVRLTREGGSPLPRVTDTFSFVCVYQRVNVLCEKGVYCRFLRALKLGFTSHYPTCSMYLSEILFCAREIRGSFLPIRDSAIKLLDDLIKAGPHAPTEVVPERYESLERVCSK